MKRVNVLLIIIILSLYATYTWADKPLPIEIKGISGNAQQNVQSRLELLRKTPDFLRKAPENVRAALEPFGFYKASVDIETTSNKIIVNINPGPALTISQLDITLSGPGKDNPKLQKFIKKKFPLAVGHVLEITQYEKAKNDFFQIANNQGYLKAEIDKKAIEVNLKQNTARVILHFNTGQRYYFGHISFGTSPYAPEFLQRFVTINEGEPFSSQKLLKFQQDLRNSRFFQQVEAIPDLSNESIYSVPVRINTTVPKSQRYDVGIGYGTFTGARVTLGADFRRLTDTGHHFTTQIKVSSVLSGLGTKYYIPGNNPLTDQYTIGANVSHFAPKNGSSLSQTLSASYEKTLEEWQRIFSLNYLNERYQVINQPTHRSQVFYPSMTLSLLKTDNKVSPRYGNMLSFTIQGASQDLGSKTTFLQSEVKGKSIFSPTHDSRVILRGDLGYTVVQNLNDLPLTLNYFAGGIGSVRGYPYSSLGPGKYLEVASIEGQQKIIGDWSGAIFYDVGNASNTFNGNIMRGDGLGVIYNSFVGPMRLYVARAESSPSKPRSIEFSIGPEF